MDNFAKSGIYPLTVGEGIAPLTVGDDYTIPNYGDWYPYAPYQPYTPYDPSEYYPMKTDGNSFIQLGLWQKIEPSGAKYERRDLPVVELQLKDQCGYTVITKVDKITSGSDGFLRIYYKDGRQKKTMMILESNILAIHKTGWEE